MQKETGSFWGFCRLSGAAPASGGTTVRHGSNLTPRGAHEGSESVIVTRQGPTEQITQYCEPERDRGTYSGQGGRTTDRGSLERSRRAKSGRPSESEPRIPKETTVQSVSKNNTVKHKRNNESAKESDKVIYSTKPSNVNSTGNYFTSEYPDKTPVKIVIINNGSELRKQDHVTGKVLRVIAINKDEDNERIDVNVIRRVRARSGRKGCVSRRSKVRSRKSVSLSNRLIRVLGQVDSIDVLARSSSRSVAAKRLARNLTCSKSDNEATIITTQIKISKLIKKLFTEVKSDKSPERKKTKTKMADKKEEKGWKFQRKRNANKYSVRDFLKLTEKDIKAEKIEEEEWKEAGRDTTSETSLGARTCLLYTSPSPRD